MKNRRIYKTEKRPPVRLPQLPDILGAVGCFAFFFGCAGIGGALDQARPIPYGTIAAGIILAAAGVVCIHLSLKEEGKNG